MASTTRPRVASADRRRQILAVASDLFARHGFRGTTTREIARAARMNEALLFRHFPGKEELYWAVIEAHCERGRKQQNLEQQLQEASNDLELFTGIAEDILRRNQQDPRLTRLLLYSGLAFAGFALGNAMLVVDLLVVPTVDLALLRSLPILAGLMILIYGLVWDAK